MTQITGGAGLQGWPGPLTPQDARSAYGRFVRLLLTALSRLAATGFAVPPDEGMDLIHDFFVQAWPGLEARYDATRASFDTYVFGSFLRFARPRIARLNRLRSALATPGEIAALAAEGGGPADPGRTRSDVADLRRAVATLPAADRALLRRYLGDDEPSERTLAAAFGLSRYEVRTRLADALGTVAARLGASDGLPEPDRSACRLLWLDRHTPREAAGLLRLPVSDIHAARRRILARLVRATKGHNHMSHAFSIDRASPGAESLIALVRRALGPEATPGDLLAVARHREAIQGLLAESGADAVVGPLDGAQAERIGAFYEALSGEAPAAARGASAEREALLTARADDARAIGSAFAQALLADLPRRMVDFGSVFAGCPQTDEVSREALRADASIVAAGGAADGLVRFGLTPSTIARALRAMRNLARRRSRAADGADVVFGVVGAHWASTGGTALSGEEVSREVEWSARLPSATATRLYGRLHGVAGYKPALFEGFQVEARGEELHLCWVGGHEPDLFRRWSSAPLGDADGAALSRG